MTTGTAIRTPKETIGLYYEYANAGRWDEWCSLFTEDMVMDEQLAGHIEGQARLREVMAGMGKMYSRFQNVPRNIVVDGDEGTVVSHISAASPAGVSIEAEVMNYFRFRDGRIAYMENSHDTRPFAPVMQRGEAPAAAKKYPIVHRFSGKFMELPRDHVNAYVVELEKSVVVIDTTLALSSARALRAKAESFGKPIRAVLLTHGHPDHYTGLVEFGDVPRIASQGCLDFARQEDAVKSPTAKSFLGDDYPDVRLFPNEIVSDGGVYVFDGVSFTFRDLGPGESPSDGMWMVEKDGVKHVFVGDVMALNCHCFFRDGHTLEWNKLLERLRGEFDASVRFYLGHGESPVGREAIDWQLGYNTAFLNAVNGLEDKSVPIDSARQEQVIAAMKKYLPADTTMLLLNYELGETVAEHLKLLSAPTGSGEGRRFYLEQLQLMSAGEIDALVERHYHPDAVMVTFDGLRRGHAELKKYYVDTLKLMGRISYLSTQYFVETEDVIAFKAVITSDGRGTVHADNALYMKEGKILRHIALTLLPDVDYDKLGTRWKD